jgi:glycosyltransferase involved in cell wall biosynthesis
VMDSRITLLYIFWKSGLGGVERLASDFVENYDRGKYDCTTVIVSKRGQKLVADNINEKRCKVLRIECSHFFDVRFFFELLCLLWGKSFDVVHNNTRSFLVSLGLLLSTRNSFFVFHEHGMHVLKGSWKTYFFYLIFQRMYNVIIATNEKMAKQMQEKYSIRATRLVVIENCVNTDQFRPNKSKNDCDEDDLVIIGTVARLSEEKDISLFLDAGFLIAIRNSNVRFVVVGDGPLRGSLMSLANRYSISEKVEFLGNCSNVPAILNKFDLFIFTSRIEAFGMVILEALSCAVPVLAAPPIVGGARLILEGMEGVVLCKDRKPTSLARDALKVISDRTQLRSLGRKGRADVVNKYQVGNWISALDSVYQFSRHYSKHSNKGAL